MKEGTTQSAFSLDNLGLLASMKNLGLLKVAFNHSLKIFLGLKLAKEDFPIGQHGKNFVGEEVNSLSLSLSLFLSNHKLLSTSNKKRPQLKRFVFASFIAKINSIIGSSYFVSKKTGSSLFQPLFFPNAFFDAFGALL